MIRKDFYLTEQQIKRLEKKSDETGLTVSELIRRAVDFFLSEEKDSADNNEKRS